MTRTQAETEALVRGVLKQAADEYERTDERDRAIQLSNAANSDQLVGRIAQLLMAAQ